MSLQKAPTRDNWTLSKLKVKPSGESVDFKSEAHIVDGSDTYVIPYNGPYPICPHSDLTDLLNDLKIRLASYYGYTLFDALVAEKKFDAKGAQKKYTQELTQIFLSNIKVTGISYAGKERLGVCITGTYNGNSINTKPLYFSSEEYGESLQETCDKLDQEVYEYIFMSKKAQLDFMDFKQEDE